MENTHILLADDHPVFRYGMRSLLQTEEGFEVVGEATTGREVIALAASLQPDIILMDLNLPELNGIEATRRILSVFPQIKILVLTMFEDDDSVFAALRAGARGYILKGAEGEETMRAIEAVSSGEAIFSRAIAQRLTHYFGTPHPAPLPPAFPQLTEREREVLTLLGQGYTNAAIAERLVLSPKTVRNHVSVIFGKLQVAGRAEAIARARDAGLTPDAPPGKSQEPFRDA
jgi:DNA-binding NarL/FixJ family response regulator